MKNFLIYLFTLSLSFSALAESSKRESVEELLKLTNAEALVSSIQGQIGNMLQGIPRQMNIKPDEQQIFDTYMQNSLDMMKQEVSWDKMKGTMVDIYLKHFSEQEIQDLLVFYRTKTGHAMIEKMPMIMADSMQFSQQMMQDLMPKMQSLSTQLAEDLKAHRAAK